MLVFNSALNGGLGPVWKIAQGESVYSVDIAHRTLVWP